MNNQRSSYVTATPAARCSQVETKRCARVLLSATATLPSDRRVPTCAAAHHGIHGASVILAAD